MLRKTLIYDTSKGLARLIKRNYSDKLEIHLCKKINYIEKYKISDFELCFFAINDIDDFFLFKKIYYEIDFFFIVSHNKILSEKINNLNYESIIIIDFDYNKKNILDEINFSLTKKYIV